MTTVPTTDSFKDNKPLFCLKGSSITAKVLSVDGTANIFTNSTAYKGSLHVQPHMACDRSFKHNF